MSPEEIAKEIVKVSDKVTTYIPVHKDGKFRPIIINTSLKYDITDVEPPKDDYFKYYKLSKAEIFDVITAAEGIPRTEVEILVGKFLVDNNLVNSDVLYLIPHNSSVS